MASMFGRFAKLSFSPAVRASRNGVQRRFISEQTHAPHLEIDANARGNVLLLVGLVALPLSIYTVTESTVCCLEKCVFTVHGTYVVV